MAKYRKLGRTSDVRKALLRSQVTALIANGKIVTTLARAKEVQKIADGLIALGVREKHYLESRLQTFYIMERSLQLRLELKK